MDPHISGIHAQQSLRDLQKAAQSSAVEQVNSEQDLEHWCDIDAFNPMAMMRRFRPLNELREARKPSEKEKTTEKKVIAVQKAEESAARFQRQNDELKTKTLMILRAQVSSHDTTEEVLNKVLHIYPDHALADEALDFLLETADPATNATVRLAKERLGTQFGREIKAGRNIGTEARTFAKEGLGSPTALRDLYRDITGTPREPLKLFDELSEKYPFEKLIVSIRFLLHALGSDLRAKGPSIPPAELKRLIDETRSLQGILGIYRFFRARMNLIKQQFEFYQIAMPPRLNFDLIARLFVKFLAERILSPDKIIQASRLLGISEEAAAQMIIFTQMRDAIKQVAPRYYRSDAHRDELFRAFLKALEELDKKVKEEERKEKEQQRKKKPR